MPAAVDACRRRHWRAVPSCTKRPRSITSTRSQTSIMKLTTCSADDDRELAHSPDLFQRLRDILDDRRLDALGGLVEHQDLRVRATSARAMASCCCWPPERLPPAVSASRAARGKSENSSQALAAGKCRASRSGCSPRRSAAGRSCVPAAHTPIPRATRSIAGQARDFLAGQRRSTRLRTACMPISDLSSVVLPIPLRPMKARISPSASAKLSIVNDMAFAVADVQVVRSSITSVSAPR